MQINYIKKHKNLIAITLIIITLILSGCSAPLQKEELQILKSYQKENAPSQVVKTEKNWIMLNSTYDSQNYSFSVGKSPDSLNNIYSVQDVSIWYFDANDKVIAWCEKSTESYTYKVYNFDSKKVETIFKSNTDKDFQPQNIGVFHNNVYYCFIDYDKQEVQVSAYDIESKDTNIIHKIDFIEENQPYSINVENENLSLICSNQIKVFNLQNNDIVFKASLSNDVKYVFTVSYDSINDTCALYYADNDSENIGILKEGETKISSVFTFSENHYAFQDKIECHNGHIYWISQANVSGLVAEHYILVDYNYMEHTPIETKRTFGFYRSENNLYVLRFNKNRYTHIDLCQYDTSNSL